MAWIEKRKIKGGISYYVLDRRDGKRICQPAGPIFQTAKDIKRRMEDDSIRNSNGMPNMDIPLQLAYDEFEVLITKTKAKRTWPIYKWGIDKLMDFLNNDRKISSVSKVSKPDILKFRARIMKAHNINGMINIMKYVRNFFNFCIESGYIAINPAAKTLKGIQGNSVAHFLTNEEIRHIIDNCHISQLRDIIKIVLLTGMREEEICDFKSSWIKKDKSIIVDGKGSKHRKIPISNKLWPILEPLISTGDTPIFPGWSTGRIRQAWGRAVKRAKKKMKLGRTRFHDLRHTFASNLLQDGVAIETVQALLGHENIATTMIYSHLRQSHLATEIEKMKADFLEATPPQFRVA